MGGWQAGDLPGQLAPIKIDAFTGTGTTTGGRSSARRPQCELRPVMQGVQTLRASASTCMLAPTLDAREQM